MTNWMIALGGLATVVLGTAAGCKKEAPKSGDGPATAPSPPPSVTATEVAIAPAVAAEPAPVAGYAGTLDEQLDLGGGVTLWLGFPPDAPEEPASRLDQLVLRATGAGGTVLWQRNGFRAIAGVDQIPDVLTGYCDDHGLSLAKEQWGDSTGVRVSVACRAGEDMFTASEVAILLELSKATAVAQTPLWVGEANHVSSEHGRCTEERLVSFALAGPELVVTTITAKGKRGTCRPTGKPRIERTTVNRASEPA